jgi:hypothetical protein
MFTAKTASARLIKVATQMLTAARQSSVTAQQSYALAVMLIQTALIRV